MGQAWKIVHDVNKLLLALETDDMHGGQEVREQDWITYAAVTE